MKSAWDTIETSVGPLDIKACARNYFNIKNPKESNFLLATVTRQRKGWEIDGTRADGSKPDNDCSKSFYAWALRGQTSTPRILNGRPKKSLNAQSRQPSISLSRR
jgi:hypothetical protein